MCTIKVSHDDLTIKTKWNELSKCLINYFQWDTFVFHASMDFTSFFFFANQKMCSIVNIFIYINKIIVENDEQNGLKWYLTKIERETKKQKKNLNEFPSQIIESKNNRLKIMQNGTRLINSIRFVLCIKKKNLLHFLILSACFFFSNSFSCLFTCHYLPLSLLVCSFIHYIPCGWHIIFYIYKCVHRASHHGSCILFPLFIRLMDRSGNGFFFFVFFSPSISLYLSLYRVSFHCI